MDKQNIAKRIIEQKKLNSSKRKPKYATRKLSIGLVSCMLGYALLVSPSSVEAAELDSNNQAVVEEASETKEEEIKIGSKDFVNIDENSKDKAVYMTINNILVCKIILEDKIRDDTKESIEFLKNQFLDIAVLSGDSKVNVENLAKDLSISYAAELKSDDKFEIIKNEQKNGHKLIFVGDGDNDSQILKKANLGISMGQVGSNLSLEASDILISDKSYSKLKDLINIAKIVDKTAKKNLIFIIFAKILMIILALLGFGSMWLISLIEVSILLITIITSLNILNKKI